MKKKVLITIIIILTIIIIIYLPIPIGKDMQVTIPHYDQIINGFVTAGGLSDTRYSISKEGFVFYNTDGKKLIKILNQYDKLILKKNKQNEDIIRKILKIEESDKIIIK